jgi:hypothetical protein
MRAFVILAFAAVGSTVSAQQRDPAFEVYALTGAYFHSNVSVAQEWKPQFGAGVLAPLGRKWAAMMDVTTSTVEATYQPGDRYAHERRVVLMPAFVRLWRMDRVSVYFGGGVAFEHERQRNSMSASLFTRTDRTLHARVGTIVSLTRRVVARTGFSWLPRYIDEKPSSSFEAGVGYRF